MKTLEIVVNDINKAFKVAETYGVEFEPIMVGEAFSKLAIIRGETDNLIDFILILKYALIISMKF